MISYLFKRLSGTCQVGGGIEGEEKEERERESSTRWTRVKPGANNINWVSLGCRDPRPASATFLGSVTGAGSEAEEPRLKWHSHMECQRSPTSHHTCPAVGLLLPRECISQRACHATCNDAR